MKRLNLIPKETKEPKMTSAAPFLGSLSFKIILVLLLFLAAGSAWRFFLTRQDKWRLNLAKNQLEAAKVQLSRLQTEQLNLAKESQDLLKKKAQAEARIAYLKGALASKPKDLSEALVYLPTFMPDEIWVNKLSIDQEQMVINGSTLSNHAISALMDNLNGSKRFRDSNFGFTQKGAAGEMVLYNFEIVTHPVY